MAQKSSLKKTSQINQSPKRIRKISERERERERETAFQSVQNNSHSYVCVINNSSFLKMSLCRRIFSTVTYNTSYRAQSSESEKRNENETVSTPMHFFRCWIFVLSYCKRLSMVVRCVCCESMLVFLFIFSDGRAKGELSSVKNVMRIANLLDQMDNWVDIRACTLLLVQSHFIRSLQLMLSFWTHDDEKKNTHTNRNGEREREREQKKKKLRIMLRILFAVDNDYVNENNPFGCKIISWKCCSNSLAFINNEFDPFFLSNVENFILN